MFKVVNGVNTYDVPPTVVLEPSFNPQQKSAERNGNGKLIRDTLPDKWTVKCEWQFQSNSECVAWFNILKTLTRVDFQLTFPAPTGNDETITVYISPISTRMLSYALGYNNIKCNFVEV